MDTKPVTAMEGVEYRIKPVTRYIITRYHQIGDSAGVDSKGEYDNADVAYDVGYALCRAEHEQLGWPFGDERIQYPRRLSTCGPGEGTGN
jgi:hypothetical protein